MVNGRLAARLLIPFAPRRLGSVVSTRCPSTYLFALTGLSMSMPTCQPLTSSPNARRTYFVQTYDARRRFSPAPAPRALRDTHVEFGSPVADPHPQGGVQSPVTLPTLGHPGGERAVPTRSTLNKGAHSTARVWRIIDGLPSTMVVAARSTLNKGAHSTARACDAYQTDSRSQRMPARSHVSRPPPIVRWMTRRRLRCLHVRAATQARHRPARPARSNYRRSSRPRLRQGVRML